MRTRMHIHFPPTHAPRGRHIIEALLVGALVVAAALGLAYVLSQRAAPAPSAAVSSQPWLERFYDFKRRQVEQLDLRYTAKPAALSPAQLRFEEFKRRQAEQLDLRYTAKPAALSPAQVRFEEFKRRQAEARDGLSVSSPGAGLAVAQARWESFKLQQSDR